MIWKAYPNVAYYILTRQSSGNWGRYAKQHAFLYQLWTTGALLNILLGPSNHDSQNSPNETHELGSWVKKWDDVPWVWTMGFDAFLCEYEFFWVLKEIFPKFMIVLTWHELREKFVLNTLHLTNCHPLNSTSVISNSKNNWRLKIWCISVNIRY